ncbi:DUF4878 domain-containing protein [Pseudobacillus wudalianchiensis]|uniref:DUF4878 domain-containing protein n=1 Tax=Pseudobacillus wudalianchiensis TaxID=1743143 RepID=A0A1B9B900_9BACI|nr:DUF4878 domain-containing protein [Bacillus wudalianchiensis]OCA92584.1 hypothetical protein A8F95_02490 [Bacillus wudalianchiensis]
MKRFWLVPILAIATIAFVVIPFLANSKEQESSSPEEFVKEYLNLSKAKDYESMANLAIDERSPDLQTKIERYKAAGERAALEKYKIKEVKDVTEETATVVTVLTFKNGMINQTPIHLVKEDGDWKVLFTGKDANSDEDFKLLKRPDGI